MHLAFYFLISVGRWIVAYAHHSVKSLPGDKRFHEIDSRGRDKLILSFRSDIGSRITKRASQCFPFYNGAMDKIIAAEVFRCQRQDPSFERLPGLAAPYPDLVYVLPAPPRH